MEKWNRLVLQFLSRVMQLGHRVLNPVITVIVAIFGRWQAPVWTQWLFSKLNLLLTLASRYAAILAVLVALGLGIETVQAIQNVDIGALSLKLKGWQASALAKWKIFQSVQPDADAAATATIQVTNPSRTPIETDSKPRPVVLKFSVSAAPLTMVGHEVNDIKIHPEIKGKWRWAAADRLEFTPDQDWPIDVEYNVVIGQKALASHVLIDPTVTFHSPRFETEITEASFYQDPVQVELRRAVFEVSFSHPVSPDSFEKHIALTRVDAALFKQANEAGKLTVTFDKYKLKATVHTAALTIPAQSAVLTLRVDSGVKALRGGNPLVSPLEHSLTIPGLYSLDITELKSVTVTNENGEAESVLQITAAMDVNEKVMASALEAWILPAEGPAVSGESDPQEGSAAKWTDAVQVTEDVLAKSQAVKLNLVAGEREVGTVHAFKYAAEPDRVMLVRIKKGLKSAGGFLLGANRDELIAVKRSAPELSIMSKGALLALSGEKKLPLIVRDLPGVRIELARLLPHQLQHLVSQSSGDMTRPEFYNGITPDNLSERFEKKIPLAVTPGKTHYETVDFAEYLHQDAQDRRGIFLLTVQGYDPKQNKEAADPHAQPRYDEYYEGDEGEGDGSSEPAFNPEQYKDYRLVMVTDLGIITKQASDGAQDVFVQSIGQGQPVDGATVEIWARNGAVIVSQQTDPTGVAHLPPLKGLTREKTPEVLVVRKGGDLSYLPIGRYDRVMDVSRFDVGGLRFGNMPNQMQAYLFSDRGMYRPGDTMHIGIMAKASNWSQVINDLPVEVEVVDARGLVVRRENLRLSTGGLAEFTHTTQESSPTGNYTVNLNLARNTASAIPGSVETAPMNLGSVTVKVQEFMPDRMKVASTLSQPMENGWVRPNDLTAKVNVQNLFGAPAQERRVTAHLTLTPTYPAFRDYPDYVFYDPKRAKEKFEEDLAEAETDANGDAQIGLGLQRYALATYQMHVLMRAFEPEGGRSVATELSTMVSDMPYLVGYKATDDLSYVAAKSPRRVNLLAINPQAKAIDLKTLKLVRVENKVLSVLMKQPNGLYKYESRSKEAVLDEKPFQLAKTGTVLNLNTEAAGNFAYVIKDENGLELSRIAYSVAGVGNISRSLDRNAELQLSLNKKDYQPGEEIEISVRAPYTGTGLITIEREKVFTHKWFTANSTASVQKITLPKEFEGSGYVSVQFVRDLASDEIYMSPMSYGVVPFATNLAKRTNPVALKVPALVKPGATVDIALSSPTPTKAVVFAVDEGILQVARYKTPDPVGYFFRKRALEVNTSQTLDLLLPEFKKLMQSAAPGGDGESLLGKNLNPFKRKRDKPVAFWSGVVDVQGDKTVQYKVPESFNGNLRIFAVTVNQETAAIADTQTTVRGDLILLPNLPVAMTPGDQVEVGVGVANQTKGSGKLAPVTLSVSVSNGLEVIGPKQQVLKVSEGGEASTKFVLRAKAGAQAQLGSATLALNASLGAAKAHLANDISVRPASAYVTLVQSGLFKGQGELKSIANMYPNFMRNEATVSSSPWGLTSGLMQYLEVYPHGCSEQITSQIYPTVLLSAQPALADELLKRQQIEGSSAAQGKAAIEKSFTRYLTQARSRQNDDGGFAMWPGGGSDMFATTYITGLLIEAKERKLAVPNDMLLKANVYMQSFLANRAKEPYHWRDQTYAAYLLTRQGVVTTAALSNLQETHRTLVAQAGREEDKAQLRHDIGVAYLASSYQLLHQDKLAADLMKPVLAELKAHAKDKAGDYYRYWYWAYYMDPMTYQTTAMRLIAKHFPSQLGVFSIDYWKTLAELIDGRYYQSHSSAMLLLAVDAYQTAVAKANAGKIQLHTIDDKGVKTPVNLPQGAEQVLAKAMLPLSTKTLQMANAGDLPMFYTWAQSGFERKMAEKPVQSGMEVEHQFLDASGNPVTQAKLGDELTVRVRIRSLDKDTIPQVALVDVLPGGLEPVLSNPADAEEADAPLWRKRLGGQSSWAIDYADIREDRVVFYGSVSDTLTEVTYKVRASNAGDFVVPSAYAEAMYEQKIFARAAAGRFKVTAH